MEQDRGAVDAVLGQVRKGAIGVVERIRRRFRFSAAGRLPA
jgi:hypothetical protein